MRQQQQPPTPAPAPSTQRKRSLSNQGGPSHQANLAVSLCHLHVTINGLRINCWVSAQHAKKRLLAFISRHFSLRWFNMKCVWVNLNQDILLEVS